MTDPKLVVTSDVWESLNSDQKLKITYDTTISTRETLIDLSMKVDEIKKGNSCYIGKEIKEEVEKLKKGKIYRNLWSLMGGIIGGIGGSHIPKT